MNCGIYIYIYDFLIRYEMLDFIWHFVDCLHVSRQLSLPSKPRLDYQTLESKH